jgi:hypothetical protein
MNILNLFTRKSALIENGAVVEKKFVPTLPLDIYEHLPEMPEMAVGPNGEALLKLIANAYPEGVLYPNARENRIKLYQSIYFLRTKSSKPWVYDVETQYKPEEFLLTRVARKQHSLH